MKKQTRDNRETGRNRLAKVESGNDLRKKRVRCEGAEVEKHVEAEMIKYFELAMWPSHESKKVEEAVHWRFLSPSVCIS